MMSVSSESPWMLRVTLGWRLGLFYFRGRQKCSVDMFVVG